ncbi:MAG: tRNA pseudouridine(55) synthase TruB [Blastocatellia bacterium]|jgi:tRNA pseudouridine55 synthase
METDGILIIDKPAGWTSHDVVAKARGILRTRRIGHTGTLDPFATGVLVLCLNRATRVARFLTGHEKEYVATIRLGWRTETGDLTGQMIGEPLDPRDFTRAGIEAAVSHLRGPITQIPPMFSAKKQAGRKLYELARAGKEVERAPIEVTISRLDLLSVNNPDHDPPALDLEVHVTCSAGTYIRTLAEDVGQRLGVGAHLVALRRLRAGRCLITEALTLEAVAGAVSDGTIEAAVHPMATVLDLPVHHISEEETVAIGHGRPLPSPIDNGQRWRPGEMVSLCGVDGQLIAIAQYESGRESLAPRVVLA